MPLSALLTLIFLSWFCGQVLVCRAQTQSPDGFNPGVDGVEQVAMQPDGKILVWGVFTNVGGQPRTNIARLNSDGSLDPQFNPLASVPGRFYGSPSNEGVLCFGLQADGKVLLGGKFTKLNNQSRTNLARLNADGTLDGEFNPSTANGLVSTLAVQTDGKVLAASTAGDYTVGVLRRFNPDGTLDTGFVPQYGIYEVGPLALQTDGRILMDRGAAWVFKQPQLSWLNQDGSLDSAFGIPDQAGGIASLRLQSNGKILISGLFTNTPGQTRWELARLNADGSLDKWLGPDVEDSFSEFAVQADGKILINGSFRTSGGPLRYGLARLNADGTLDSSFPIVEEIGGLALQADGRILVTRSSGGLGRLNNTGPAMQRLMFEGSTITWLRGGTSPEVWATTFESSVSGVAWTPLGNGRRVSGGWQLTNVAVNAGTLIRARGFVAGSSRIGGGAIVEATMLAVPQPPVILTSDRAFGVLSNRFGFNVNGHRGLVIIVEGSTNLLEWLPLQTNTLGSTLLHFNDPNWQQKSKQFYRVRGM